VKRVCVIGGGAWGTVFGQLLVDAGAEVALVTRDAELAQQISRGENPRNYPGVELAGIAATANPAEGLAGAELVLIAVGAQTAREVVTAIQPLIPAEAVVASLIKGIEVGSGQRMSEVLAQAGGLDADRVAVVSGPNLAGELLLREPSATVVACTDEAQARRVASRIATPYLRPYTNPDVVGVEICGAMKNIVAMAVGAARGLGYGYNTCATLMTRGLAEMTRVGLALGADLETFAGMAGFGDLAATCFSARSRNFQVGNHLGQGLSIEAAITATKGTAEAVSTSLAVQAVARKHGVDVPITDGVVAVTHGGVNVKEMGRELLARPFRSEGSRYLAWPPTS
jgi:glycerol-3-phosphate dehydrogenase (NAD(P)+)